MHGAEVNEPKPEAVPIEVSDRDVVAEFVNLALVRHTPDEFVLDFIFIMPGANAATVAARIITSPGHAKRLSQALADNVARYEANLGPIRTEAPKPTGTMS